MGNRNAKQELQKIVEQLKNKNNPKRIIQAGNDEDTLDIDADNQSEINKEELEEFRRKYNRS